MTINSELVRHELVDRAWEVSLMHKVDTSFVPESEWWEVHMDGKDYADMCNRYDNLIEAEDFYMQLVRLWRSQYDY